MSSSKHRTSFALDEETIGLLHVLAGQWCVSQAEVVRRAVRIAASAEQTREDELQRSLTSYWESGAMTAEQAQSYLSDLATQRGEWERGSVVPREVQT